MGGFFSYIKTRFRGKSTAVVSNCDFKSSPPEAENPVIKRDSVFLED